MQSFDVGPVQVRHIFEQGGQPVLFKLLLPPLNDPVGHTTPSDDLLGTKRHFVLSVKSWVKLDWQVMQFPVTSSHSTHPS